MDEKCNNYVKVCFKKAELIYKRFYHIVFLEICKSFNLISKGLEVKKSFCLGGTSENFEKKWDANLREMERKCRELLLEEHSEKLFCLMDSFWEVIAGANVNFCWLTKIGSILIGLRRNRKQFSGKKCLVFLEIQALRKWFLRDSKSSLRDSISKSDKYRER